MVFSSITFLVIFLPLFLLVYTACPKAYRSWVMLIFSAVFYAWGAPRFVFVLFGTTLLDFYLVNWIDRLQIEWKRRLCLVVSLSLNLGLLFYFKYYNFFLENVNEVLSLGGGTTFNYVEVILPVGISFYTFETITYVVDVYRRVHKPLSNFWDYQRYIILFPKLIAGPIVRFHTIADQLMERTETVDDFFAGFIRFCVGLGKKVLLANVLGQQADAIMDLPPDQITTMQSWIGILAYTFQIYFDFSGYSDMALGLGRVMGFRFPENFNNPYTSTSISEFWRRWHISLGQWMKNYLYIPLGGNRANSHYRVLFNLWFVFLVSGLWHGASWNFVIWGVYHGMFLILDRLFLIQWLNRLGKHASAIITFLLVVVGWVFFRIETTADAFAYLHTMFVPQSIQGLLPDSLRFWTIFLLAAGISFSGLFNAGQQAEHYIYADGETTNRVRVKLVLALLMYLLCLSSITTANFNPFIYFRF